MCDMEIIDKIIQFSKGTCFVCVFKINTNVCTQIAYVTDYNVTGKVNSFVPPAAFIPCANSRVCCSALLGNAFDESVSRVQGF